MTDISVPEKVKTLIVERLGVEEGDVKNESSFRDDLGADSLDTAELIMDFEKQFNINIPDAEAEKVTTVAEAIALVEKMINPESDNK